MSDKKKKEKQIGEKTLKLQDLDGFTVGEIVEQSKRIDQENLENETALDKYIRQHRNEIEEAKSKNLDEFIQAEREKLAPKVESEADKAVETIENITDESVSESETVEETPEVTDEIETAESETIQPEATPVVKEKPELDPVITADEPVSEPESVLTTLSVEKIIEPETVPVAETLEPTPAEEVKPEPVILSANEMPMTDEVPAEPAAEKFEEAVKIPTENSETTDETPKRTDKKSRKTPIIIGLSAVALIAIGAAAFAQYNANQKPSTVQTAKSSSSNTDMDKFKQQYEAFFTDKSHQALKNSAFNSYTGLEKLTNSHKDSTAWAAAISEIKDLKAQIDAITLVNNLFTKPAITDGKLDNTVQIVSNVKIPSTPKTSNNTLNKLLSQAIDLAKTQNSKATAAKEAAANNNATPAPTPAPAQNASDNNTSASSDKSSTSTNTAPAASNPNSNGGLSAAGVSLDNSSARVQPQAGLDASDLAFTWGDGILDKILTISRSRGYITGNAYILVPVAIHTTNGTQGFPAGIVSGYYNMYTPDGSYLFTVNDKTGYFFGNGKGLPTDF